MFRERNRLHDEVRGEAAGADGEAAARCPGPAKRSVKASHRITDFQCR